MKNSKLAKLRGTIALVLVLLATAVVSPPLATEAASNTSSLPGSLLAPVRGASPLVAAGDLDISFNRSGMRTIDFRDFYHNYYFNDRARAVAIQSDGKIVVAGETSNGSDYDFGLVRINTDGLIDESFGLAGYSGHVRIDFVGSADQAYGVAIQPDGKIVVVGGARSGADVRFAAARLNPDGKLDGTFSYDGKTTFEFYTGGTDESNALSVAIQPDGKIVMAGYTEQWMGAGTVVNLAVARLLPNGDLDTSFDGNGMLTTDFFGRAEQARAVAIQPDGKIVVAGYASLSASNYDFALARYNSNGSLDASFSGDGKVNTDFLGGGDDGAYGMALQPDGKIVAVGGVQSVSTGYDFGVARYNSNGSLDTSFPGGGMAAVNFVGGTATEVANGVVIQPDGKIVMAGYAPGATLDFALARLLPSGALDTSFNGDGKLTTDFAGADDNATAVALQPDGKIVAVGISNANDASYENFAVARYLYSPVGAPDFSISITPSSQTVTRPNSVSYTITVTSLNGFNGSVDVTPTRLGLTDPRLSIVPRTIYIPYGGSATTTLTASTVSGTRTGTYVLTVNGEGGGQSHSRTATLIVR